MTCLLRAQDVCFSYRHRPVLTGVSLDFEEGGVTAVLGPNGSGKTTLLKVMLGLLRPSRGKVQLNGEDIRNIPCRAMAQLMAYVPQIHREAFAYRVEDVVLMGRMPHKSLFSRYDQQDFRLARESMDRMGIGHLAQRAYTEISGGERQLALIARAMTQGARIFIMDEPTNGLDYGNQVRLLERLSSLSKSGFTFAFSTHHPDHALSVADRVVMLREGRIIRDDGPSAISGDSLEEIYGVDVRVVPVSDQVRVCVPALRLQAETQV